MATNRTNDTGAVSIADVAHAAGVSISTVSRVINEAPDVSVRTRDKVRQIIADLEFIPNSAARTLSLGSSQTITLLSTDVAPYGYGEIISGVSEAAQSAGFGVDIRLLPDIPSAGNDKRLRQLLAPGAGALIVVDYGPNMHQATQEMLAKRDVVALVRSQHTAEVLSRVSERSSVLWLDENLGMKLATQYLLSLGHKTVHHISVPAGLAAERSSGWRQALEESNRQIPDSLVVPGWGAQAGFQSASVLAADPEVTAVLCGNDEIALGVMKAMEYVGRNTPRDVSVMGFDGNPESNYFSPSLSSVVMDWRGLGIRAAQEAIRLSGGDEVSPHPIRPPYLEIRASTAPPSSPDRKK